MSTTKVVTKPLRISYPKLFVAQAINGSETKKYSVVVLWPKEDKETDTKIREAIAEATRLGIEKRGKAWATDKKFQKNPLIQDGDVEYPEVEAYQDHYFLNCSNTERPGVFDRKSTNVVTADDSDKLYPGCYACISINFFNYDAGGNKGISASLQGVLKAKEGDRLDNRSSAAADFADVEQFEEDFEQPGDEDSYDEI